MFLPQPCSGSCRLLEEEQAGRVTLRRYRHTPAY